MNVSPSLLFYSLLIITGHHTAVEASASLTPQEQQLTQKLMPDVTKAIITTIYGRMLADKNISDDQAEHITDFLRKALEDALVSVPKDGNPQNTDYLTTALNRDGKACHACQASPLHQHAHTQGAGTITP